MSDHDHVVAARKAEQASKPYGISIEDYLSMRSCGKGASLIQMIARKWATSEDIVSILKTANKNDPYIVQTLREEVLELLESKYCTQELIDRVYAEALSYYPLEGVSYEEV